MLMTVAQWCQWVTVAERLCTCLHRSGRVAGLIREAVRYTGDQETLPLSPLWIGKQL